MLWRLYWLFRCQFYEDFSIYWFENEKCWWNVHKILLEARLKRKIVVKAIIPPLHNGSLSKRLPWMTHLCDLAHAFLFFASFVLKPHPYHLEAHSCQQLARVKCAVKVRSQGKTDFWGKDELRREIYFDLIVKLGHPLAEAGHLGQLLFHQGIRAGVCTEQAFSISGGCMATIEW